ncbi:MAG: STAS domain-containing protein [Motiliproteus sp.]
MVSSSPLPASMVQQASKAWLLSGDLDTLSGVALRQAGVAAVAQSEGSCRFDFSGVTSVTSVALSLVLCWSRQARQDGVALQFDNLPDGLSAIAELCDLGSLLDGSGAV